MHLPDCTLNPKSNLLLRMSFFKLYNSIVILIFLVTSDCAIQKPSSQHFHFFSVELFGHKINFKDKFIISIIVVI